MEAFWEISMSIMSLRTYLSNNRKWFIPTLEFAYTVTPLVANAKRNSRVISGKGFVVKHGV